MVRKNLPAISPSETEILRLVWQLGRATVQQVCDKLPARRRIAYATVQTLLRRLESKGYLKHDVRGKAHVFFPAVKKEHVVKRSVGDFLDRLFGGDAIPLVQYLAEHGKLSTGDIEQLKQLTGKK
jgi:predicted transcriptional regulator